MTTQHIEHFEQDMATVLGLPNDVTQVALLAVAYFTGSDFKPAKRGPAPGTYPLGTMGEKRGGRLADDLERSHLPSLALRA
jgi:hypothetical protein